jgi:hypothetical protein
MQHYEYMKAEPPITYKVDKAILTFCLPQNEEIEGINLT